MKFFGNSVGKWETFLRPLAFGIVAGLAAVAFQKSIHFFYANGIERFSKLSTSEFLIFSFLSLAGTSAIAGIIVSKFNPGSAGSGSPQLKSAFWKDFGVISWRTVWTKFVGSVISIGGGASLGNEGPMVQIGGGVASNLAGRLGVPAHMRRTAAAAGAAAGLAAIFNAPMAAVAFVLEEVVENLNSRLIGSILLAAVAGALVSNFFMGGAPVFTIQTVERPSWLIYALTPVIAVAASVVGVIFQKFSLGIRKRNKAIVRVPAVLRVVLGAVLVWAVGSIVFLTTGHLGVFFLGYDDLTAALNAQIEWWIAGILLIAKVFATSVCYGLGGIGGIFAPALFFGGMTGAALAGLCALFLPLATPELVTLGVVGMCACFGSVVRAPVTGVLLVFEMTHNFSMVPALMFGGIISIAISKWLTVNGFYDDVLAQDGNEISKVIPPKDLSTWQDFPVSRIANFSPVTICEFSEKTIQEFLSAHEFSRVPVVDDCGKLRGLVTREDLEDAISRGEFNVRIHPMKMCLASEPVRDVEKELIDSIHGIVAVTDGEGHPVGVLTLHDILRTELAFAER